TAQGAGAEYRPGGRVSAGVLGIARPHGAGPRPEVGLSGLDQQPAEPESVEPTPGRPVMGGYRTRAQPVQASSPTGTSAPDLSTRSESPPAPTPPPVPSFAPEPPAAPAVPPSPGTQ